MYRNIGVYREQISHREALVKLGAGPWGAGEDPQISHTVGRAVAPNLCLVLSPGGVRGGSGQTSRGRL